MPATPSTEATPTKPSRYQLGVETPLGPFVITADDAAIVCVGRGTLTDGVETSDNPKARAICWRAAEELEAYFMGSLRIFTVPIHLGGSPFQKQVWAQLEAIDFGDTRTYGDVARRLGDLGAVRAVGMACGANPIPLIVPCHRVVASSGGLGGFGLGTETKVWLLEHEGARGRQLSLFG